MEKPTVSRRRLPLWKKIAIGVFVLALIVIALVVGLVVGLRDNDSSSGGDNEPSSGSGSGSESPPTNVTLGNYTEAQWKPAVNTSWQIVLQNPIERPQGSIEPDVDAFDVDLFTNPTETISALHDLGKHVICYFSAGSYEPYRPDSDEFQDSDLGKTMKGWPDERWLDITSANVRDIMAARIMLAAEKGCDAIDPDNVDGYSNANGVGLTEEDTIDFLRFLSRYATSYGMAMGLKNAGSIVPTVSDFADFSVNEQCVQYSECATFAPFIEKGKPVFHIEYPDDVMALSDARTQEYCSRSGDAAGSEGFSTVLKKMDLDGFVRYCDDDVFTTATMQ